MKYEYNETFFARGKILCTSAELFDPEKKFTIDGKFAVKCEGILTVENGSAAKAKKWVGRSLGRQLWEGDTKNFTIMVGEKTIQVHKSVLSDCSPVFKAMFNPSFKEAFEHRMEITDFSYETVEAALQLLYDRRITSMTLDEKTGVLQFLDKYQIFDLKNSIEASLIKDVSISTVCRLANCSIISNASKLQEKCLDFLVDCGKKEVYVKDIDDLDKDFAMKVLKNAFSKITVT